MSGWEFRRSDGEVRKCVRKKHYEIGRSIEFQAAFVYKGLRSVNGLFVAEGGNLFADVFHFASSSGLDSTSATKFANTRASASLKPRVVMAAEPMRMPEVTKVFPDRSEWRFVDGDVRFAQSGFGGFACNFHRLQVDEENVAFGAAGNDAQTAFDQFFRHGGSIDFHLFCVLFELGLQRFFKRYGFGGDDVHQRTALQAWEDGRVQCFSWVLSRHRITPPRGPRRVLWVVVVTKSQNGTGLGYSPPAISPA